MATPTNLPASFTSGDVLTAVNMNNLRGAFRILQVVSANYSTQTSSTSGTYADSGLSATITCQATSSKVLVVINQLGYISSGGTEEGVRLVRNLPTDPTVLQTQTGCVYSAGGAASGAVSFIYLDSPASTSAITYRTQLARTAGAGTVYLQINSAPSNITLFEVSA